MVCSNYQSTKFLDITYKILLGVIRNSISPYSEEILWRIYSGIHIEVNTRKMSWIQYRYSLSV